MNLVNTNLVELIQSTAIASLNEHEMKKPKSSSSGGSSSPSCVTIMNAKTKLLVELVFEMTNKPINDATVEMVFFSSSIRNFSMRQLLAEIFAVRKS